MAHTHSMVDTDVRYKIDGVTRTISNLSEVKRELVKGDHNSEILTFELPRFVDGHDFAKCNVVEIHYTNYDKFGKVASEDVYPVTDLMVSPYDDDENTVIFTWRISRNATVSEGTLDFSIRLACTGNDVEEYAWNTTDFSGIKILPSRNNSQKAVEQVSDVVSILKQDMSRTVNATINEALDEAKSSGEFDGREGYTPVKGVDYYTAQDKAEFSDFISSELAKRGQVTPEFGHSEEWLQANGDPSKLYVMPDGMIWANTYVTRVEPAYTNILDTVTLYENKRWSHSSKKYNDADGHLATDKFPVKKGDIIRINVPVTPVFKREYTRAHYFADSGNYVAGHVDATPAYYTNVTEVNGVSSWEIGTIDDAHTALGGNVSYLTGADDITNMILIINIGNNVAITPDDYKDLIVTINEPIEMREVTDWRWVSTGHAFVPADYDDRIAELEDQSSEHARKLDIMEKVFGGEVDSSYDAAIERIKNWKYPVYEDAPVFLLDNAKPGLVASDKTTDAIYAKYDALMALNPGYITKVEWTETASDGTTPLYAYHLKEADPHNADRIWSETKPIILICSGVHPTEQAGVHSMYYALAEITNNPKLRDLRRNVHFIVVPMLNPSAFSDEEWNVRNPAGVQVHYNFEVDFNYPGGADYVELGERNHGGETPLSMPETRFFDSLMQQYRDNLACVVSCHNNDVDTMYGTGYIWCSCATHFMCNVGFRLIDKMSNAWRDKYGSRFDSNVKWANQFALDASVTGTPSVFDPKYVRVQPDWDYRVGRAALSASGGTEYKQALKYGVHGINVEACARCMILDRDYNQQFTSNAITLGTETYINFFRTFMAVYDPKNKKDYASSLPWNE